MSKKLFLLPTLLLSAMLMFAPGCGDADPCKDVDCGANGTCFEGACVCNEGYDKDASGQCTLEWNAKFLTGPLGYTATSSCLAVGQSYIGDITKVDATTIKINEFGGFSGPNFLVATVTSSTGLTINYIDDSATPSRKITGTGSISGKLLTITVAIDYQDGGPVDNCTDTITLK